jgi:hypothetical protein
MYDNLICAEVPEGRNPIWIERIPTPFGAHAPRQHIRTHFLVAASLPAGSA